MAAHGLDPQRLDADQHGLDHVPADRLDLGSGRLSWLPRLPRLPALPRGARGGSSAWWRAAGLLAVGGLLGWGAHAVVDPVPAAPHRPTGPSLVAGSLQH